MFPRLFSHKETPRHHSPSAGLSQKNCSTWGDYESGVHNHGVNGSLGDESPRAYIVELGAGYKTFLSEAIGQCNLTHHFQKSEEDWSAA